jgi:hypothetical protein
MLLPSWAVQVHMYAKCYGYIITVHFGIISIIVLHSICIYHDDMVSYSTGTNIQTTCIYAASCTHHGSADQSIL